MGVSTTSRFVLSLVVVVVLGVAAIVYARGGSSGVDVGRVDRQVMTWNAKAYSTSNTRFTSLFGPAGLSAIGKGPMTLIFSAEVEGAPIKVRVREGRRKFRPGAVRFEPGAAPSGVSFTFLDQGSRTTRCHTVHVEWKSVTGATATASRRDAVLLFNGEPLGSGRGCGV